MLKRPRIIALTLVALLALAVLNLPGRVAASLKLAVGSLFVPLFGLAESSQNLAGKAGQTVVPRSVLTQELESLRKENQALQIRLLQAGEMQRENDRLHDQLGIPRQSPWKCRIARVIGRDPANWWRTVIIDLGARDGVRPNATVLTAEGLVGRVSGVGNSRSQVVLVGDPNCRVAAMILETRDTTGIIVPPSADTFDNTLVDLTSLSRNSTLKPGQRVCTSGQGGVFPKGIPIGQVVDWRAMEFGLYAEARVKLAVNYNQLQEVWVATP